MYYENKWREIKYQANQWRMVSNQEERNRK